MPEGFAPNRIQNLRLLNIEVTYFQCRNFPSVAGAEISPSAMEWTFLFFESTMITPGREERYQSQNTSVCFSILVRIRIRRPELD
jgi:hypothetical protein